MIGGPIDTCLKPFRASRFWILVKSSSPKPKQGCRSGAFESLAPARAARDFARRASESGRLEPGDELTFPGMTDMRPGNAAVEFVPNATRGSDFANIHKKRCSLLVCGCVAHDDQIVDLTPNGLAAFGQSGQMLRPLHSTAAAA